MKGLSNTSRRTLDATLREKLPGLKIDNISFNPKAKLYTIQSADVNTYQKLLNNFPTDSFENDKNPSIFVPATIRQVLESESVCFMKNVDLEFDEDELRHALSKDGIQIKQLERITRPGDTRTSRKPTMTVKVVCKDKKNRDTLLQTGLRISFCLFRCEPAKPNDTPLQCKKCNGFGHPMKHCRIDNEICSRCGAQHRVDDCQSPTVKCSNCSSNHEATSKQCPIFIEQQKRLRRTIADYTTPIQTPPVTTSQIDYPHLSLVSAKTCRCAHDQSPSKYDIIAEQLKVTNDLVQNLATTVNQLMQMQQAMLAALVHQQQSATSPTPYAFQMPPPSLTYQFPPPPQPHPSSPTNTIERLAKQQKRAEQSQQQSQEKSQAPVQITSQTMTIKTRRGRKNKNPSPTHTSTHNSPTESSPIAAPLTSPSTTTAADPKMDLDTN